MGQFDYLTSQVINRKNDYSVYTCPLCGTENTMNSTECKYCRYSLVEFESLYFAHYNCYNDALTFIKAEKYLSAYESIITFLNFYPKDMDAQRLKLFILYLLKDAGFADKAERHLQNNNDRWTAKLIDSPDTITLNDFPQKNIYNGSSLIASYDKIINAKQEERIRMVTQIKELVNRLYDLYRKVRQQKGKNVFAEEFQFFYGKIFTEFLNRNEMNVIDYLGKNFGELSEETKTIIGSVDTIENKKLPNGLIVEVFMPEIRYHSLIIQRAKITVNVRKSTDQEK